MPSYVSQPPTDGLARGIEHVEQIRAKMKKLLAGLDRDGKKVRKKTKQTNRKGAA